MFYTSQQGNNRIRVLYFSNQLIYTLSGDGTAAYKGDYTLWSSLNFPDGLALDPYGNLLIADKGNNAVRMISGT